MSVTNNFSRDFDVFKMPVKPSQAHDGHKLSFAVDIDLSVEMNMTLGGQVATVEILLEGWTRLQSPIHYLKSYQI